jgi:predicted nucleotidyltransferase
MPITIGLMKETPILEKKYQAIEDFTRRLLASEVGDYIAKIVLFGSVLRSEASEESDIDLLIIALDAPDRVKEATSEDSFDTILELGEGVEPIVHRIGDWRFPTSYLVYKVKREGKDLRDGRARNQAKVERKEVIFAA